MDLPERITRWRESRGLTKTELAQRVGVSPEAVIQWENTDGTTPTTKHIQKLAEVFGVSIAEFWSATKRNLPRTKAS